MGGTARRNGPCAVSWAEGLAHGTARHGTAGTAARRGTARWPTITRTPLLSWPWIGSRLQRTERRQTASTAVAGVLLSLVRSKTRGSAGLGQAGDDGNGDGERRSKI